MSGGTLIRPKRGADHHYWAGRDFLDKGDWAAAAASFRSACKLAPAHPDYQRAQGLALARLDRFDEAIACFKRAVTFNPMLARAWSDIGVTMLKAGRDNDEAIACLERALSIEPSLAQARATLGIALSTSGSAERALALLAGTDDDDCDPPVQVARAWAMMRRGQVALSLSLLDRALARDPDLAVAHHNRLFTLQYRPGVTPAELFDAHRAWAIRAEAQIAPMRHAPAPDGLRGRRRRLGFVSGDFRNHAVGFLTIRALEGLARRGFDLACFAHQAESDALTARFKRIASWHPIQGLDDDRAARLIQRQRIDVLFDLSGHTGRHRLGVFARMPAAVQVSWAAYPGTTGLNRMTALIADGIEIPEGDDQFYSERVIRLPECYVTYDPPPAPEITGPPCLENGFVTFGSFNRPPKLNPDVASVWARLLGAVPGSRLLLKYDGFEETETRAIVGGLFEAAGLPPDRIIFEPGRTSDSMIEAYGRVDIALDPFPYAGGVTTLEAILMGVPVVALAGRTFAGRHSASHLGALGLGDLIASDSEAYVAIATALAADPSRLSAYRADLRGRLLRSPLCDGERFSGHLATAIEALWQEWCGAARPVRV